MAKKLLTPSPGRLKHIAQLAINLVDEMESCYCVKDLKPPPGFPHHYWFAMFVHMQSLAGELQPKRLWADGPKPLLISGWSLNMHRAIYWMREAFYRILKVMRLEALKTADKPALLLQSRGPVKGLPPDNIPIFVGKRWPPKVERALVESLRTAANQVLDEVNALAGPTSPDKTAPKSPTADDDATQWPAASCGKAADGVTVDKAALSACWNGKRLPINQHADFTVLRYLHEQQGEVVSYTNLLKALKPDDTSPAVTITEAPSELKEAASNIRNAFTAVGCPIRLKAVKGIGYQLSADE